MTTTVLQQHEEDSSPTSTSLQKKTCQSTESDAPSLTVSKLKKNLLNCSINT